MNFAKLAVFALGLTASAASASSISVGQFSVGNYNALLSGLTGTIITEDFETFSEANVGGLGTPFSTAGVGDFVTLGGVGNGGTVKRADNTFTKPSGANPNDGSQLAIRDGKVFGRVSTTAILQNDRSKDKFLDSNDTYGIVWDVDLGGALFNKILLTLTDGADTGATVTITSDGGGFAQFQAQARSNQKTILVDFGAPVAHAQIQFANSRGPNGAFRTNDGLGIDDIAVSSVPLPASALLLGAGFAGLILSRRKKQTA